MAGRIRSINSAIVEVHAMPSQPEKPIGRCACGAPYSDLCSLNEHCDCGTDLVCSVAEQDWRPCPPCFGSGRSLLWNTFPECPVCFGTGWITEAEAQLARDELETVRHAVELCRDGRWPYPCRPSDLRQSTAGSISLLRAAWPPRMLAALKRELATTHVPSGGQGCLPQAVTWVAQPTKTSIAQGLGNQ
jgi:hypothetical protein